MFVLEQSYFKLVLGSPTIKTNQTVFDENIVMVFVTDVRCEVKKMLFTSNLNVDVSGIHFFYTKIFRRNPDLDFYVTVYFNLKKPSSNKLNRSVCKQKPGL